MYIIVFKETVLFHIVSWSLFNDSLQTMIYILFIVKAVDRQVKLSVMEENIFAKPWNFLPLTAVAVTVERERDKAEN